MADCFRGFLNSRGQRTERSCYAAPLKISFTAPFNKLVVVIKCSRAAFDFVVVKVTVAVAVIQSLHFATDLFSVAL